MHLQNVIQKAAMEKRWISMVATHMTYITQNEDEWVYANGSSGKYATGS